MAESERDRILAEVEKCRRRLLDLSLRNRLLNFRPSKLRGIEVVDEYPAEVFRILVRDQRAMTFVGRRRKENRKSDPLNQDETELEPIDVDPADSRLNTSILEEHLSLRLLRIFNDARTLLEEQGINTLFLALGMLEWYEAEASSSPRLAPLILIPVTLERRANERFRLSYSGEDLATNLSLLAKLKVDFGLELPELPDADDVDVDAYFNAAEGALLGVSRWRIHRDSVHLGFFSYAKFLMYRDLDPERWVDDRSFIEHKITRALLGGGFEQEHPPLAEGDFLDVHRPVATAHEVVDADSSQVLALLDAAAGRTFVIEGPPGTGKSQTITNIIAEAVAARKKVLFVAEKMAALEVVKRFLDRVEIGDACLELHSYKARKRALLEELRRTQQLHPPANHDDESALARLEDLRSRLNAYVRALHDPIGETGVTPYESMGRLVRLGVDTRDLPRTNPNEIADLPRLEYERRREKAAALQDWIVRCGPPAEHPFFGCTPIGLLRTDIAEFAKELREATAATDALLEGGTDLASQLNLASPGRRSGLEALCLMADYLATAPADVFRVNSSAQGWIEAKHCLESAIGAARRLVQIHAENDRLLTAEAWSHDVRNMRSSLIDYGSKWYRALVPSYRQARSELMGLCLAKLPRSHEERITLIDAISAAQQAEVAISAAAQPGKQLLQSLWSGITSDWAKVEAVLGWLVDFHGRINSGHLPQELREFFVGRPQLDDLRVTSKRVRETISHYEQGWDRLLRRLKPNTDLSVLVVQDCSFEGQRGVVARWLSQPERILEIMTWNRLRASCLEAGLPSVCSLAEKWKGAGAGLLDALDMCRYEELLRRARGERAELEQFDGFSHQKAIDEFCGIDERVLRLNRARVAHAHATGIPVAANSGTMGVLLGEMHRKRGHMPIRKLMAKCWQPIQDIKPVFMMSPLSVAMFLPPEGPKFDLVVFDEASQVRPEDALGAIIRGGQLVVVGDSKQMPPTSFFMRLVEGEDEEQESEPAGAGDMESVLSLMRARAALARSLRWHYRSRHHSLITVSNACFYDRKLLVFPSPEPPGQEMGLVMQHLAGTVYGRGGSRANAEEAKAVAVAVLKHAQVSPDLTLGVVAFSQPQQDAIHLELEKIRRTMPELVAFEERNQHEPLFVKNLENVQGDERDIIFISIGYGRDSGGTLSHNFGPVNAEGGERRLNVLMTRARLSCRVFSNFLAQDIDLRRSNASGVQVLKKFLQYAETGELDMPRASGQEAGSEFEEAVEAALRREGYDMVRQVGSMGFFVDLAVVDPKHPGRYLLGIECDGAQYHSARSARDRDRLREQVLRVRGWRLHRIWSTDWFESPDRELRRAVAEIEAAKAASRVPEKDPGRHDGGTLETAVVRRPPAIRSDGSVQYRQALLRIDLIDHDLHEVPVGKLGAWIQRVVDAESPVHIEEVLRRIREASGVQRAGNRIREAIERAILYLRHQKIVRAEGEFLWSPMMMDPPVRSREQFPPPYKRLDFIAPEEFSKAIIQVAARSYGIGVAELAGEALRLLGFSRVTAEMDATASHLIRKLVTNGALHEDGGLVVPPT